MIEQIDFGTREEYLLAEEATEQGITVVVSDLNDQLTVICGLATLGAEASYDAERTENYFALIESASTKGRTDHAPAPRARSPAPRTGEIVVQAPVDGRTQGNDPAPGCVRGGTRGSPSHVA